MRQEEKLLMIRLVSLWRGLRQSVEEISLRGRMTKVESLSLSHVLRRMKSLDQMQKLWSAIIVTSYKRV